jgi:hypothetical protein
MKRREEGEPMPEEPEEEPEEESASAGRVLCPDCAGAGTRMELRPYLPHGSSRLVERLVPVRCRNCKGKGRLGPPAG